MTVPLVILAVLSLVGGFVEFSQPIGHVHLFSGLLTKTLPLVVLIKNIEWEPLFQVISGIISLSGIYLAYLLYLKKVPLGKILYNEQIANFFYKGWGFDRFYDIVFVKPFVWIAEINKSDFMDNFNQSLAQITLFFNRSLSFTQNGKLRFYIMALTIGIAAILTYMIYQ